MNTPICDYVKRYADSGSLRLHMPGHKGMRLLGMEALDITEIGGADSLYEADGIIRESEENSSSLFGCETYYSTEGSSQCIRAMLYLAMLHAKDSGRKMRVLAARNAHKTFLSAATLLDFEVDWLYPGEYESYLSCGIDSETLEKQLQSKNNKPTAVYITSPDYLGNTADIRALAAVCHRHDVLLLVDNAHGAYLRFLPESRHPIDLGADICCDSAHKTLPVLTGGAYLHLSGRLPKLFSDHAKTALMLFGSTSPSYIIMQSLDAANRYLAEGYRERLAAFLGEIEDTRRRLTAHGYSLCGDEPLKLTIAAKQYGYTGAALQEILEREGIVTEFADPDFLVMMATPETGKDGLTRLEGALYKVEKRPEIAEKPPEFRKSERVMSIREAMLSPMELLPVEQCAGRVLAAAAVGCPPAVPIAVSGERIDEHAIACHRYYSIIKCLVVK